MPTMYSVWRCGAAQVNLRMRQVTNAIHSAAKMSLTSSLVRRETEVTLSENSRTVAGVLMPMSTRMLKTLRGNL